MSSVEDVGGRSAERVRVRFTLEREGADWPPAEKEDIWAIPLEGDVAKVGSIPWFVQNIALGDLIAVRRVRDGEADFVEKLKWSGNCTLRIIPFGDDSDAAIAEVIRRLSEYNVNIEVLGQFGLVAINVPPSIDCVQFKEILDLGEEQALWSYEEACIGGEWPI